MVFPFHYEVRYRLSVYDNENKVRHELFTKVYSDDNPLNARMKAFTDVGDYVSLLEREKRISVDSLGNYYIVQPTSITNIIEDYGKIDNNDEKIRRFSKWIEDYEYFKEEISIYFVVNNHDIIQEVLDDSASDEETQAGYLIYQIASYGVDKQEIIDNLELAELELYKYFDIDFNNIRRTVYHYGLDYAESGEDIESGARREILDTPMKWNTLDYYNLHYCEQEVQEAPFEETIVIDYEKIIERGESMTVEFKRTLNYNFEKRTWEGKHDKNYIIAKTICSFLNTEGGTLFIGVEDNGSIEGLRNDYSLIKNGVPKDKLLLDLTSLIVTFFGNSKSPLINGFIENVSGKDILIVEVLESPKPIFLIKTINEKEEKEFFVRIGPSTHQIRDIEKIVEYIEIKKWRMTNS